MIPILVKIKHSLAAEATVYHFEEELVEAFKAACREAGQEATVDELDDNYADIADTTICMVWAGYPRDHDHWAEIKDFPLQDWRDEVLNDDTRLGYLDWVAHKRECQADEARANDQTTPPT